MKHSLCQLEAIYCDDIRTEDSGKRIVIGVYNGVMGVSEFPILLPKLVVSLALVLTNDRLPRESLRFALLKDDDVIAEAPIPIEKIEAHISTATSRPDMTMTRIAADFVLGMFQVEGDCKIRSRAYIDGVEVVTSALRIQGPGEVLLHANGSTADSP